MHSFGSPVTRVVVFPWRSQIAEQWSRTSSPVQCAMGLPCAGIQDGVPRAGRVPRQQWGRAALSHGGGLTSTCRWARGRSHRLSLCVWAPGCPGSRRVLGTAAAAPSFVPPCLRAEGCPCLPALCPTHPWQPGTVLTLHLVQLGGPCPVSNSLW